MILQDNQRPQEGTAVTTSTGQFAGTSTQRWVVALTGIGSLMVALDTLVVSTALSSIRLDLGASIEQLEWTSNAYNLSFAVLLITAAALGDRFGRRRLFALGLGVFVAASAVCALAPDVTWLIAARAVQGAGAALVMPIGLALLSTAFPPDRRGAAIGIFSAVTGLAVASGPFVGGAIVQGAAWEWIFWVNVPIGILTIPLVLLRMPESRGADTGLDLPGLGLVTGAAFGLVWGLVRGNSQGWSSSEVVTALVLGGLLALGFVFWESRARAPMIPLGFFRSRSFASGNTAMFFTFASLFGAVFFFAQLLQTGLGYGPLETGVRLLPWTGTFMVVAPIAGTLADRFGERLFMVLGLLLQAIGMVWIAAIAEPSLSYASLVGPLVVAGTGVSMAIPAAQNSVVGSMSDDLLGKAAGINSMMRELGGVFGIAVAVAVFAANGSFESARAFTDGVAPAIGVLAGLSLVGALVGLGLPRRSAVQAVGRLGRDVLVAETAGTT
jgi:EmrB/QacA subfamily drug resistance transporter